MTEDEDWLRGAVDSATPDPPRRVDFDRVAATALAIQPRRRQQRIVVVLAVCLGVVLVAVGMSALTRDGGASPSPRAGVGHPDEALTKQIVYRGVRVAIPSSWPVIDGAHARYGCGSRFSGQVDRAFLGPSYWGLPSCPLVAGHEPRSLPADGIWMTPGGSTPPTTPPTVLGNGQRIYIEDHAASAVTVWFRHVQIRIGIGPQRRVERAIINSIDYVPNQRDTAAAGRCSDVTAGPPAMPTPSRANTLIAIPGGNGHMLPEPANVKPKVNAEAIWQRFIRGSGDQPGGTRWTITFGSYTAPLPAKAGPNGTLTPLYHNMPAWLVVGTPKHTAIGPCGPGIIESYNADTGGGLVGTSFD